MAVYEANNFETFEARDSDSRGMARFILACTFSLSMGRTRSNQSLFSSQRCKLQIHSVKKPKIHSHLLILGHYWIHQTSTRKSSVSPRRSSIAKSIHCRMAKILYTVFLSSNALWTTWNLTSGKNELHSKNQAKWTWKCCKKIDARFLEPEHFFKH